MKRKTPGERIAMEIDPEGTITAELWRRRIAWKIDRAIRLAQVHAWNQAIDCTERVRSYVVARRENPYRGRTRKQ